MHKLFGVKIPKERGTAVSTVLGCLQPAFEKCLIFRCNDTNSMNRDLLVTLRNWRAFTTIVFTFLLKYCDSPAEGLLKRLYYNTNSHFTYFAQPPLYGMVYCFYVLYSSWFKRQLAKPSEFCFSTVLLLFVKWVNLFRPTVHFDQHILKIHRERGGWAVGAKLTSWSVTS